MHMCHINSTYLSFQVTSNTSCDPVQLSVTACGVIQGIAHNVKIEPNDDNMCHDLP